MEYDEDGSHGGAGNAEEADTGAASTFTELEHEHIARADAARAALQRFLISASNATAATEHEHQARAYAAWAALQRLDEAVWADLDAAAALTDSDEQREALSAAVESRRNGLQHDVFVAAAGGDRQQAVASWAAYQEGEEQRAAASRAAYQARQEQQAVVVAGANDEEEAPRPPPPPPPPPLEAPLGGGAAGGGDEVEVAGADDDEVDDGSNDGEDDDESDDDLDENGPDDPGAPPEPGRHVVVLNDPTSVRLQAHGFREAVHFLADADDRRPIDNLTVLMGEGNPSSFRRFVALLGPGEGGGRTVRQISLETGWNGLPDDAMERLFRDELPNHPTLNKIHISINDLPPRFLQMLTEHLPLATASALTWLSIDGRSIDGRSLDPEIQAQVAQAIVDMQIRNTNLRTLGLRFSEVGADALDGMTTSSLDCLSVVGSFSEDALLSLARQLRTNETLQDLVLTDFRGDGHQDPQALLDLVRTYNHTLRSVLWFLGPRHDNLRVREQLDGYTRRNAGIRVALEKLTTNFKPGTVYVLGGLGEPPWLVERPKSVPNALLPTLLGLVSDLPTVLSRVLKMGYVNEVGILLAAAHVDGDDQHRHP